MTVVVAPGVGMDMVVGVLGGVEGIAWAGVVVGVGFAVEVAVGATTGAVPDCRS